MNVASASWHRIRRLRALPPPLLASLDTDGRRTRVFQSALTQAEELWEAAAVAGAASRPLPLFYCVSQAGRALCAAWSREDKWEPEGHGLSSRQDPVPDNVVDYTVKTRNSGAFIMAARALGSDTFRGPVSLGALWAAMPSLPEPPTAAGTHLPPVPSRGAARRRRRSQPQADAEPSEVHAALQSTASRRDDAVGEG